MIRGCKLYCICLYKYNCASSEVWIWGTNTTYMNMPVNIFTIALGTVISIRTSIQRWTIATYPFPDLCHSVSSNWEKDFQIQNSKNENHWVLPPTHPIPPAPTHPFFFQLNSNRSVRGYWHSPVNRGTARPRDAPGDETSRNAPDRLICSQTNFVPLSQHTGHSWIWFPYLW